MNKIVLLLLIAFLVWPVSVMAGCGGPPDVYYPDGNNGSVMIYAFVSKIPMLPADGNTVTMGAFNFPPWIKAKNTGELITAAQRAAECNMSPDQLQVVVPPDCNYVPMSSFGDVNKMPVYRLELVYTNAPMAVVTGQVRIMGVDTKEIDVTLVFNGDRQVQGFIKPCK